MATTLATVTPIQSACPTGGVLDGVRLRVSSHSSHKSPVRCTSVVWRIQAITCGAERPAHELMAATSVTTRTSKPSSRATSTGQASDTVSAHPPSSRPQTLGSSQRDHEIRGSVNPTTATSHTVSLVGPLTAARVASRTGTIGATKEHGG